MNTDTPSPFAMLELIELEKQANRMSQLGRSLKRILSGKDMSTLEAGARHAGIGGAAGTVGALGYTQLMNQLQPDLLELIKERMGERADSLYGKEVDPGELGQFLPKGFQEKSSADEDPDGKDESNKNEEALRNRHLLLVLKRALQGGAGGAAVGGFGAASEEGGLTGGQGAGLGLIGGGLAGSAAGAAEGGVRRAFGLDPLLQTVATARGPG